MEASPHILVVDDSADFREPLASLQSEGWLARVDRDSVALSRDGLLRVDLLLRRFFLPEHSGVRYT